MFVGVATTALTARAQTATNPANGHEYFVSPIGIDSWTNHAAFARSVGGYLVSINDAAENTWLIATFTPLPGVRDKFFIGLSDELTEGTWIWESGEPLTFTNWGPGQPDSGRIENYCVAQSNFAFGWNDSADSWLPGFGDTRTYAIIERIGCIADFNQSGGLTVQDIFDFLVSYFGGEFRADFNGSMSITVQDIFDFLAAYFEGCD